MRFHLMMQTMRRGHVRANVALLIGLAWLVAATTPSSAADLVVDNVNGSDAQNDRGLVPGPASYGPYRTIQRALAAAQPGDRIVLTATGEPYRECVSLNGIRHSGGLTSPFQIVGNGAVLDGSAYARPTAWEAVGDGCYEYHRTPPGFGLMWLEDQPLQRVSRRDAEQSSFLLQPLQWTRVGGRFLFRPERGRSPTQYDILITEQTTGISLYDVQDVEIRDLTIRGYRIDGINALDRASGVRLINVTCEANGRSGVSVGGACRVRLESSRLLGNGGMQLRTEGRSELTLSEVQAKPAGPAALVRDGGKVIGKLQP